MIFLHDNKTNKVIETFEDVQDLYNTLDRRMNALKLKHQRDLLHEYKVGLWAGVKVTIAIAAAVVGIISIFFR